MAVTHSTVVVVADDGISPAGSDEWNAAHVTEGAIEVLLGGATTPITTGIKADLVMPFAGHIAYWTIHADLSGSLTLDLWKCTYAAFVPGAHPIGTDTICGSAHPMVTSSYKGTSSTLTGWTTAFAVGDVIRVNVDSCSTITRATLVLGIVEP